MITVAAALGALAGCSATPSSDGALPRPSVVSTVASAPAASVASATTLNPTTAPPAADQEITFDSGGVTIHGSLRVPGSATVAAPVPGVLLLAGSGPTDRDGNSGALAGTIGTLAWLADQLGTEGVATLRYDKLGAGATGLGGLASRPEDVDFDLFVQEARDALTFLAGQTGVDPARLVVAGHSEGGLIAMVLATDLRGVPAPAALALLNPASTRYLDLLTQQLNGQTATAVRAGRMSRGASDAFDAAVARAVAAVRAGDPLPADLPNELAGIFNAGTTTFLRQADAADPAVLAPAITTPTKVLLTCADADIQVPCDGVRTLQSSFAGDVSTFVELTGVDHVLKEVGASGSDGTEYTRDLPFSAQLADALHELVGSLG